MQGFFRIIKNQGGGDPSPKTPSPPPQTKVTIVGKNEIYNRENLVRPFLVHQVLGSKPPALPPPCSKEALGACEDAKAWANSSGHTRHRVRRSSRCTALGRSALPCKTLISVVAGAGALFRCSASFVPDLKGMAWSLFERGRSVISWRSSGEGIPGTVVMIPNGPRLV